MKTPNANLIPLRKNLAMGNNPMTGNKTDMPKAPIRSTDGMAHGGKAHGGKKKGK
jgi:hypothetical protein